MKSQKDEFFIPALNKQWLTPLYDPLLHWVMREERFKSAIVALADPKTGERILDVGTGTGTLSIMLKQACPEADIIGIDVDDDILSRAERKAGRANARIRLQHASATNLPFGNSAFNKAVSCLVFHHLPGEEGKLQAMGEVFRVLKPGGRFILADFGQPKGILETVVAKIVGQFEETDANLRGLLPRMMEQSGFRRVRETERFFSVVGSLSVYVGEKEV